VGVLDTESPKNFSFNITLNLRTPSHAAVNYRTLETTMVTKTEELLACYRKELETIEKQYEDDGLKHDEMAALDYQWNEMDRKIYATEKFLEKIKAFL
jgi:hypothetical protein